MSGPGQIERRVDEAYWRGRDEGFDRGYEEGRAAVRATRPSPAAPKPAGGHRIVEVGVLVVGAVLLWRALRTWPGRLVIAGLLFACSGIVSLGVAVVAVLLGAVILAWALRTGERAVSDVRSVARDLRELGGTARRTLAGGARRPGDGPRAPLTGPRGSGRS